MFSTKLRKLLQNCIELVSDCLNRHWNQMSSTSTQYRSLICLSWLLRGSLPLMTGMSATSGLSQSMKPESAAAERMNEPQSSCRRLSQALCCGCKRSWRLCRMPTSARICLRSRVWLINLTRQCGLISGAGFN